MATKSISQLDTQATANETDLFEVAIVDQNSASGYASKKESAAAIADAIVGEYQYPLRITGTTAKTIAGAINELKNLVDLLPQFAIEVVQTLPVSDISETTIYLVPAQDPEQGNYYEEYIYVNNAWELVGTTAVDLSGYYTSAQVDTLLAAKANTADVSAALELKENAADMEEDVTDIVVDLTDTIETAEGNSITLQTVQEGYAKAVTIKLTPKQDLHGYGKPWPAGGGKNLYSGESTVTKDDSTVFVSEQLSVELLAGTYTMSALVTLSTGITSSRIAFMKQNGTAITAGYISAGSGQRTSFTVTLSDDAYFIYFYGTSDTTTKIGATFADIQIESGSTATSYEPYANICPIEGYDEISATRTGVDGATATAEFPETIYGAKGDVAGGEWEKTIRKDIYDGTQNWNVTSGTGYYQFAMSTSTIKDYINALCDKLPMISYGERGTKSGVIKSDDSSIRICFNTADGITTREQFNQWIIANNGLEVVAELKTPEPFQTAPAPLTLRKGNNTITTDGDSVKVKYNKLALPDIGGIGRYISALEARIEALEGGSNNRSLSVSPVLTKSIVSDSDTAEGKTEETEEETKEEAQKNER